MQNLPRDLPRVRILGVPIVRADEASALAGLERLGEEGDSVVVAFANAHTLNLASTNPAYRAVLERAEVILNDGIGVQLAARMRGTRFPANLNGSDFLPGFLRLAAARGWSVFLLGSDAGVADAAGVKLTQSIPGLKIAGAHHGFFADDEAAEVAEKVRASEADVVLVGMGNPRQELWLDEHLKSTRTKLGIGVGAFLDFTVGTQKRAPAWMNKVGLEWVWRLAREPRRMWQRYVVGNPVFLARAWRTRRSERSYPHRP